MSEDITGLEAELIEHQAHLLGLAIRFAEASVDLAVLKDQERKALRPLIEQSRKERAARQKA